MTKIKQAESKLQEQLKSLEDPQWDSEEEEHDNSRNAGKKTTDKKAGARIRKASRSGEKKEEKASGVLYLGHLPKGMEEPELRGFLSQFGRLRRLRVERSIRTGGSRGYGFCEFEDPAVAVIVAETLSGYLIMGEKRLVCHVVPRPRRHLFAAPRPKDTTTVTPSTKLLAVTNRIVKRQNKKRKQLEALGITYDFPAYADRKRKDSVASEASAKEQQQQGHKKKKRAKRKESFDDSSKSEKKNDIGSSTKQGTRSRTAKSSRKSMSSAVVDSATAKREKQKRTSRRSSR